MQIDRAYRISKQQFRCESRSRCGVRQIGECSRTLGQIESNYQVRTERHTGADLSFMAYDDKDRLYNEVVLGKPGYEVTQLT